MDTIRKLLMYATLCVALAALSGCALFLKSTGEKFSRMATITEAKSMLPYYQMKVSHLINEDSYFIYFYFYSISPERTSTSVSRGDQLFLRFKNGREMMYNMHKSTSGVKVNDDYYSFELVIHISKSDLKYIMENPIYSIEWVPSTNIYTEMEIPLSNNINMAGIISDFVFDTDLTSEQEALLSAPQKVIMNENDWDY